MTFDEAKNELISQGYKKNSIRRFKAHLSDPWTKEKIQELNLFDAKERKILLKIIDEEEDEVALKRAQRRIAATVDLTDDAGIGVFPVYEDGPDRIALRPDGVNFTKGAQIIRYHLNQGTLNSVAGEFWIPCAFDGVKGWEEYYCSPHWIESAEEREAFCNQHYAPKSWPDEEGKMAEDPIRFINSELSFLRSAHQFNGSSDVDDKFREESVRNMRQHSEQAFEYLSKAVAISLKRNEPEHRQVSQDELRDNQGMTPYVDADAVRIIELAFRAGREAATASLHYRGIPIEARQGKPLTDGQSKAGPKKHWTESALHYFSENPSAKSAEVAQYLKDVSAIYWDPEGSYRNAETICFYDDTPDKSREQFQKSISKLKKS